MSGKVRKSKDSNVRRSTSNSSKDRETEPSGDPEQDAHLQIVREIENYSANREYYDKFYSDYLRRVRKIEEHCIIETFCLSTIKLNSLQASHKSQEVDKIAKIKQLGALQT
jgi:hypothetical protein